MILDDALYPIHMIFTIKSMLFRLEVDIYYLTIMCVL